MKLIVGLGKALMTVLYTVFKLLPTDTDEVLFLSRQSDQLSLDFRMLKEELEKQSGGRIKIVAICNRLDDSGKGLFGFALDTVRSMYHLATSSVCVLDAYWPAVCMLKHKASLTVIQMWHAIGKIKKSGYQTVGKESGRSRQTAELLCMHRNYDRIIAGGKAFNRFYCESFGTTEDKLLNIGLPRIDHLLLTEEANRRKVFQTYPELEGKKIILYAPTFRRYQELNWEPLIDAIDFKQYVLLLKSHPNQELRCNRPGVLLCPEFSAVDLLAVCDYLITDYSAIALEAAVLNKKTYYYLYDYEEYTARNGINVNPFESMPGCAFQDAKQLMEALTLKEYPQEVLDAYRRDYLPENLGSSTESLAREVLKHTGTSR
ncbi:MAG: CDP-glycerol glycerophosphotransferase family protein [Lachnospiraceae bacterium]